MRITTLRLILRQWQPADREPFAALNADPQAMRYFPAPLSREASDALADRATAGIAANGYGLWAVERRDSGAFIGFVGLNAPAYDLPFGPCTEIGWRLHPEHWGRGFATEAGAEALRFGFAELALAEIVSFTATINRPSEAVMRRLGMCRESQTFLHPKVDPTSVLAEHVLYRMTREDWSRDTRGIDIRSSAR